MKDFKYFREILQLILEIVYDNQFYCSYVCE